MRQATTMTLQQRLPPLWLAGSTLASAIVFVFGVARWIDHFTSDPNAEDFRLHAVAARIGLTQGWSHIYDIAAQRAASAGIGPIDSMHVFVSPPPAAWMAVPLAWLPIPAGYLIWTLISLASFVAAAWLVVPGSRLVRATLVLLALGLWPMHYQFWLGQWTAITIAMLAVSWWMLEQRRWVPAGVALALAFCLKPQDCLLLPIALLVSGRWRPIVAFGVAGGVIGLLSALSLGTAGITSWLSDLALVRGDPFNAPLTYSFIFGHGPLATGVEVALGASALGLAWLRRERLDLVFALGLVGTMASATYLHEDDVAVLVLAAWIVLRAGPSGVQFAWLLAGIAAAQLIAIGLPVPMLVWEPVWIVFLGLEPILKRRPLAALHAAL
ncbi:MAG: DUF2029 domain-containing protein [Chloroflexi bacterium]|nr:MAG: DUF2029 domain-containing protein [Chloroflexota bacterium]